MAKKIRVVRVMEYIYDDVEMMEKDMANWTIQHDSGPRYKMRIKSATLPFEIFDNEEDVIVEETTNGD